MPLYEYEDNKGHIIEYLCGLQERPDEINQYCELCKSNMVFKRIVSAGVFWGDFGTASSENYEKKKKRTKPGIEKSGNSVKINSS